MELRRTKIVATLGPASSSLEELENMMRAGLDVVRLNFSHGKSSDHQERVEQVRQASRNVGRVVAIMADLQGPKIRVAKFRNNKIFLEVGDKFILDADLDDEAGDQSQVGLTYKGLPGDVSVGDLLLLDDGLLELTVTNVDGARIHCEVVTGGHLSNNKGINRKGGGLSAEVLTEKDKEDIKTAVGLDVDYIALSFPRSADDVRAARKLIEAAGGKMGIVSKIERAEAIDAIDDIVMASDAVMVARGDLGVEIGDALLPGVQKHIIQRARSLDKAVITATQMMESMVSSPIPTRAEVFDVANAVIDGTDAVMLSAETATGDHPHKVIEAMARICLGAEKERKTQISKHRLECQFSRVDEAIAMATMYTANHLHIKAIVALTESGSTPLWMSRIRSGIPVFALTRHPETQRRVTLYRGIYPVYFDFTKETRDTVNQAAIDRVRELDFVSKGDLIILTKGDLLGVHGGTNAMKILEV